MEILSSPGCDRFTSWLNYPEGKTVGEAVEKLAANFHCELPLITNANKQMWHAERSQVTESFAVMAFWRSYDWSLDGPVSSREFQAKYKRVMASANRHLSTLLAEQYSASFNFLLHAG